MGPSTLPLYVCIQGTKKLCNEVLWGVKTERSDRIFWKYFRERCRSCSQCTSDSPVSFPKGSRGSRIGRVSKWERVLNWYSRCGEAGSSIKPYDSSPFCHPAPGILCMYGTGRSRQTVNREPSRRRSQNVCTG